jgi:hypothetical protein
MQEFDLKLKDENEVNKLLECDYLLIGGVRFIKEDKVSDMFTKWKNKFMSRNGSTAGA